MNEFSQICRILGSLFYRSPDDLILTPLLTLIMDNQLQPHWPLVQDALLKRMAQRGERDALLLDYQALFGENGSVSPYGNAWAGPGEASTRAFFMQLGVPLTDAPADHIGQLLLAASWIEVNQQATDEALTLLTLFDTYLLPWCGRFLGQVEAHAATAFYRTLAILTREALAAMWDELSETV